MDISMMGWVYPLWAYPPNGHAHIGMPILWAYPQWVRPIQWACPQWGRRPGASKGRKTGPVQAPESQKRAGKKLLLGTPGTASRRIVAVEGADSSDMFHINCLLRQFLQQEEGLGPARAAKQALCRPQNRKNELGQKEWACPPGRDVTHGYTHGGYTQGGHAHDKWVYPQGGSYPPWEGLFGHNSIWTDEAYWGLG
ncbi:hypothetical protein DFH07DRAFT_767659 [Mycena maculata]|uniref:Uncharacterized protein n=1 Tax=Mycena maculata TaxID=230809 RepID=A0AAD7JZE0_9AGAR|nr:hypothetical protein DFH07DRAFT_767659 [Mycena maculata]